MVTGDTPDIIEYLDFRFYNWVTYHVNAGSGETLLSILLGVSHEIEQLMSYWMMALSGNFISCTNLQRLPNIEMQIVE